MAQERSVVSAFTTTNFENYDQAALKAQQVDVRVPTIRPNHAEALKLADDNVIETVEETGVLGAEIYVIAIPMISFSNPFTPEAFDKAMELAYAHQVDSDVAWYALILYLPIEDKGKDTANTFLRSALSTFKKPGVTKDSSERIANGEKLRKLIYVASTEIQDTLREHFNTNAASQTLLRRGDIVIVDSLDKAREIAQAIFESKRKKESEIFNINAPVTVFPPTKPVENE